MKVRNGTAKCRPAAWNTMGNSRPVRRHAARIHFSAANRSRRCSRILIPETKAGSILESVNSTAFSAAAFIAALVGGEPGIGKSTLLLQMCRCAKTHACCSMFPGENRSSRSKFVLVCTFLHQLYILAETDMGRSSAKPGCSGGYSNRGLYQTVYKRARCAAPGGTTQIRNAR